MRFLMFMSIYFIEWFVIFSFIFLMFRFQIKGYIVHIVFASLIISQFSFLLRDVLGFEEIAPFIQLGLMILFLWLMFRIQLFYAAIMATMGYIFFIITQIGLAQIIQMLDIFTLKDLLASHNLQYIFSLISSAVLTIVWVFLSRRHIGFSFVPDSEKGKIVLKGENIAFLIITVFSAILVSIAYVFQQTGTGHLMMVLGTMILVLSLFLYLSFKKENKE